MLPIILSVVGSMLPVIVDAFRSGKSPEEAASVVASHRSDLIGKMTAAGMKPEQAAVIADEQLKGALEKEQLPEAMSPFVSAVLSLAGAAGGYKAGGMIASKMGKAAVTGAAGAAAATAAASELPKAPTAREAAVASVDNASRPPAVDPETAAAQLAGRPRETVNDIAAQLDSRRSEAEFRKQLATKDDGIQALIDDSMPKKQAMGDIPEFLPGEFERPVPSASLAPWETMPEATSVAERARDEAARAMGFGQFDADRAIAAKIQEAQARKQMSVAQELRRRQVDALVAQIYPEGVPRARTVGTPALSYSGK